MNVTMRPYRFENDYWRMRAFLRDAMMRNALTQRCWHVARLDYARWHVMINCAGVLLKDVATLWEDGDELIGFTLPDGGPGEAHIMIRPDYASKGLEAQMIDTAELSLASVTPEKEAQIYIWAPSGFSELIAALKDKGYSRKGLAECQWMKNLPSNIDPHRLPEGYSVRSLGDGLELLERCYASGLGFHNGDIKVGIENREDPSWYRNIQTSPLYRRDLDIVAIAPDGSISSFCTVWFDDVTRTAYFEPVATIPSKQRMGLGRAVIAEGLIRVARMGAVRAFVSGYSEKANALYSSMFGPEFSLCEPWYRRWQAGT